jgi:RNA polymerase sigma-70 factor (ECF subfamily)
MSQVSKPPAEGRSSAATPVLLAGLSELIERLYQSTQAQRFGLNSAQFQDALERSSSKNFPQNSTASPVTTSQVAAYLENVRLEDLVLATACIEDCPGAWDHFVATYRSHLRASASAILHCPSGAPAACELADSLFADLYGLSAGDRRERSLFRYFHGRSSLKTWLRAVLAQRHVDSLRAARRFTDLESGGDQSVGVPRNEINSLSVGPTVQSLRNQPAADPHRDRYLAAFARALDVAIAALDSRDLQRLRLYYASGVTLAEVGRDVGEHESSVSRSLERTRRDLRRRVMVLLREGSAGTAFGGRAMSDEEILLCFEYAAEDAPIDLRTLFLEQTGAETKGKEERR